MNNNSLDKAFSNQIGLITFAHYLFDLQKTIPQDRYVEPTTPAKKTLPPHVDNWLQAYMKKEIKKQK